jgi:phytoene dehydrogenase-like protein
MLTGSGAKAMRSRITLELIGTPLTHARFLRRHQGTYGPAIAAGQGMFPGNQTPIPGLYRVGDSTMPGIGVPAVAASGILCANTLVKPQQTAELLN